MQEFLNDPAKIDKALRDYFYSVDKNKNGILEYKEIKKILIKFAEDTDTVSETDDEIKKAFDQLDSNKDGKISFDEFKALFEIYLKRFKKQIKNYPMILYGIHFGTILN